MEHRRREQRDPDECDHQPGAQMRTHDAAPAVEDQLHDVATDQEHQQGEQDQVQVDQQNEYGVGTERPAGELREPGLEQGERHHREGGEQDDESLAAPPADVSRLCGHGRWLLPIPHQRPDDRERRGGRQGAISDLSA
jgi:hypothetical protein